MKKWMIRLSVMVAVVMVAVVVRAASTTTCTATGFNSLTAAMVNPGDLVGVSVNAAGCDIGVYYSGTDAKFQNSQVYGALYYGVMVHGDTTNTNVDILDSSINTIGDTPLNGVQRGVAIYYRAFFSTGTATGRVSGNLISKYQKGGIVVNGPGSNVQVQNNEVLGEGPITYTAQNGIQFGYGSSGSAMKNTVRGHSYSGPTWASGGILVVGGAGYGNCPDGNPCALTTGVQFVQNTLSGNDVDIYLSNWDVSGPPADPTNIKAVNNTIVREACYNSAYTAAVSDVGNNDKIIGNKISGLPLCATTDNPGALLIDTYAVAPKVHANK